LEAAGATLIANANERGGEDNITVILAGVGGDVARAAAGETVADTLSAIHEFGASDAHSRSY
jgi:serine/threonine protein phosphatase PrpC